MDAAGRLRHIRGDAAWSRAVTVKTPRQFFRPLAIGAPEPCRELPLRLERMIHFVPPHLEKVRAKVGELAGQVDIVLGNLEDAIPVEAKQAARDGFIAMGKAVDFGRTGLWTPGQCAELALVSRRHHRDHGARSAASSTS